MCSELTKKPDEQGQKQERRVAPPIGGWAVFKEHGWRINTQFHVIDEMSDTTFVRLRSTV